jgi:cell division protein FtsL
MLLLFWMGSFWREDGPDAQYKNQESITVNSLEASASLKLKLLVACLVIASLIIWPIYGRYLDDQKQEKEAVGPILVNNTLHLLIIEKTRKGSEEQFQAMKDELVMEHQKQQVDELFQAWVDRKKLETELVINK